MLALNERTVEIDVESHGKTLQEIIPALHPSRKEIIEFVLYQPPPLDTSDRGTYEEWMERLRFIKGDLHKLLQLPYDKFWCQVVFDEKLHRCLDAYLQHAPRRFESLQDLTGEAIDIHQEMHRLVFMSYLRMSTCKETKENFITPKVFGDILYENFLFDIPKIMDLCALYGRDNGPLMSKMIGNIFIHQPKYCVDLKQTLPAICQVFDNICMKCGVQSVNNVSTSPQKLTQPRAKDDRLVTMDTEEFSEILFYLCDTSFTLSTFLEVYPDACQIFASSILPQRLVCFFDAIIPALEQGLKTRKHTTSKSKVLLKRRLQQSRKHLVQSFHHIVQTCYIQPILENSGNKQHHFESFLDLYGNIQGERRFLADLESHYPLQDDLDILTQAQCMIDETRVQFIQDGTNNAFATFGKRKKPKGAKNAGGRESPDGSAGSDEGVAMGGAMGGVSAKVGGATSKVGMASSVRHLEPEGSDYRMEEELAHQNFVPSGAGAPTVSSVELDSLITAIKDLLPDLGEGFIEQCLEEFNYDQEKVINCVLEDNLPVPLHDLDRALARVKKDEPEDLLSQRRNIYDFDEFDVFNRDQIDMSRVIIGKKEKNPAGIKSLDDKSELSSLKPLYDRYGSGIMGESVYEPDMYDDEYDDTYDTGIVGARDDDSADELASRRVFTVPRVLQRKEPRNRQSNSEDSSEEEKNKDEFITNPEVLRAKAEQRAQWKAQNKRVQGHRPQGQMEQGQNRPQGQSQGGQGQSQKKYDVKGKAKGQGQEAGVVRNRNFKDKHKSSMGNHNRKAMADKKRMKGMASGAP